MEISRLSEEEKKAIELLKEFKKTGYHTLMIKYNNDRIKTNTKVETAIQTVLNLVKKQQEEMEFKNDIIKHKDKVYKTTKKSLKGQIAKKDKIIDEMVKYIDKVTEEIAREKGIEDFEFCDNKCADIDEYMECIDCIKQYFENKVEGSK